MRVNIFIRKIFFFILGILGIIFYSSSFEFATIPTTSMITIIRPNESCLVSKNAFGFKAFSSVIRAFFQDSFKKIYFKSQLGKKTLLPLNEIQRGDVVSFIATEYPEVSFAKRIIGVPGDKIQFKNSVLYINDQKVEVEKIGLKEYYDEHRKKYIKGTLYRETLPGGKSYETFTENTTQELTYKNTPVQIVPKDHYLIVGDFRSDSSDSRGFRAGLIHRGLIIGKLIVVLWHSSHLMKFMRHFNRNTVFSTKIASNIFDMFCDFCLFIYHINFSRLGTKIE